MAKGTFGDQLLTRSGKWEPLASAQSDLRGAAERHLTRGAGARRAAEEKLAHEFKRPTLQLYKASDAKKFHRERRFATVEAIFD